MIRARAFTLIEYLFSLALLAVLAAVLFPVFARGRGCGCHHPTCQSNLKQLALAIRLYQEDYGTFPPAATADDLSPWAPSEPPPWGQLLLPYTKNTRLFQCPSQQRVEVCSYLYNARLSSVRRPKQPEALMSLGDSRIDGFGVLDAPEQVLPGSRACRLSDRHNDGANFAYADGHVKWLGRDAWRPAQWFGELRP